MKQKEVQGALYGGLISELPSSTGPGPARSPGWVWSWRKKVHNGGSGWPTVFLGQWCSSSTETILRGSKHLLLAISLFRLWDHRCLSKSALLDKECKDLQRAPGKVWLSIKPRRQEGHEQSGWDWPGVCRKPDSQTAHTALGRSRWEDLFVVAQCLPNPLGQLMATEGLWRVKEESSYLSPEDTSTQLGDIRLLRT